jgi:hypothetical protein
MEKKFQKAMARLISRAAILMQVGAAHDIRTSMYPSIGSFHFSLDQLDVRFDRDEHPFDESEIEAVIDQLDGMIQEWKENAKKGLKIVAAWEA